LLFINYITNNLDDENFKSIHISITQTQKE